MHAKHENSFINLDTATQICVHWNVQQDMAIPWQSGGYET